MSKLILFEWRCQDCNHKFAQLSKSDVRTIVHEGCGGQAKRILSAGHIDPRLGLDPGFPTMAKKWADTRKQRTRIDNKYAESHGPDAYHPDHGTYNGNAKT